MGLKKNRAVPEIIDTIEDPRAFLLSLIGAEALAQRDEDGPLARPWRSIPTQPQPIFSNNGAEKSTPGETTDTDG